MKIEKVYLVCGVGDEHAQFIGVFASEEDTKAAIEAAIRDDGDGENQDNPLSSITQIYMIAASIGARLTYDMNHDCLREVAHKDLDGWERIDGLLKDQPNLFAARLAESWERDKRNRYGE